MSSNNYNNIAKTIDCPNSAMCLATTDKPYFEPKKTHTLFERIKRKHEIKCVCKLNNYYCPDCIYHDFKWDGAIFRGNVCRLRND